MSTEQQKPVPQAPPHPHAHAHHKKDQLETNALGERIVSGWEKFKQGKLISYRTMAIVLLVVTAIGLTLYIWMGKKRERAREWIELEQANSLTALEDFAKAHPDTRAAKIADLDRRRYLLGPEGIDRLVTREESERTRAVANIDKAREILTQLAEQIRDDPALKAQCYIGLAKSEAALIGLNEQKGTIEKLIEWLDKLADVADGTPWGDDAKKLSASLKSGPQVKDELTNVQRALYNMALLPPEPGSGPLAPSGGPFSPGIPGLPGTGGPLAPTPKLPDPKAPDPKPADPKPPEPKPADPKAPDPKAPDPKAPDPKAPAPKLPEPKPPEKTPDPKAPPPKPADPKPPEPAKK